MQKRIMQQFIFHGKKLAKNIKFLFSWIWANDSRDVTSRSIKCQFGHQKPNQFSMEKIYNFHYCTIWFLEIYSSRYIPSFFHVCVCPQHDKNHWTKICQTEETFFYTHEDHHLIPHMKITLSFHCSQIFYFTLTSGKILHNKIGFNFPLLSVWKSTVAPPTQLYTREINVFLKALAALRLVDSFSFNVLCCSPYSKIIEHHSWKNLFSLGIAQLCAWKSHTDIIKRFTFIILEDTSIWFSKNFCYSKFFPLSKQSHLINLFFCKEKYFFNKVKSVQDRKDRLLSNIICELKNMRNTQYWNCLYILVRCYVSCIACDDVIFSWKKN